MAQESQIGCGEPVLSEREALEAKEFTMLFQ